MNNYAGLVRKRNQTLLIVEGNHEKNVLFWLIFRCFPEMNINMEHVWIYGTNIYLLYEDIVKAYGENWAREGVDIDLPFVISKKQTPNNLRYREDFTNIILVFDYERHDTQFSEKKIRDMQKCFSDSTDMGKLYLNYPMIESYQHLVSIPDNDFVQRTIPVSMQPGSAYKEKVKRESAVRDTVHFPHKINDFLEKNYAISDVEIRKTFCEDILGFSDAEHVQENLQAALQNVITDARQKTLLYTFKDWIHKAKYTDHGQTYWQYARNLLLEIIYHNIYKAYSIQNSSDTVEPERYRECFESIDLEKILTIQNTCTSMNPGFIWVLNTSVFVVADFNFSLVQKME